MLSAALFVLGQAAQVVESRDFPSVQAAIDSCPGGSFVTVRLPAGVTEITKPLVLKDRVTLQGQAGTVLKCVPAGKFAAIVAEGRALPIGEVTGITSDRMGMTARTDDPVPAGTIIGVETGKKVDGHVNEVDGSAGGRLDLHMPVPPTVLAGQRLEAIQPVQHAAVRDLTVEDALNAFKVSLAVGFTVTNVRIVRSKLNPLFVACYQVTVEKCELLDCGGGLSFQSCTGAVADGNTVTGNRLGGVFFRSCSRGSVLNNKIRSSHAFATDGSGDGVTVVSSVGTHVRDNQITDTSCYGMWLSKSTGLVVKRNVVKNSFTSGYYLTDCTGCVVQDNLATDLLTAHGFAVERGSGNSLLNNRAERTKIGFVVKDADSCRYVGNLAVGCDRTELLTGNRSLVRE